MFGFIVILFMTPSGLSWIINKILALYVKPKRFSSPIHFLDFYAVEM